jgi:hypothetical protein
MVSIVMAETIPLPDWAETTGSPTGSVQTLEYINSVIDMLETEVLDELSTAESPEAKLAVVYRESIKSRLYKVENSGDTYALMKALAEIQRFLELYKSQWEYLYQGDSTWDLDLTDSNSIGRVMAQLNAIKELQKRLDDPEDILEGLTNYNGIFEIPGGAMAAYHEMEKCVWSGKRERAENLMDFLLQDCNKNGFTKGNTYFFKGKTLRMWHHDLTNSINYTLKTHKYPGCLVYIAWSYFDAAKMLRTYWHYDEAIALLSVEIPNIDMIGVNLMRNLLSGDCYINKGDHTNGIRHLQAAIVYKDKNYMAFNACVSNCMNRVRGDALAIWAENIDKPFNTEEVYEELRKGYYKSTNLWCGDLIREALEHDWPLPDEVPMNVISNRLLSNNIFEYKKRTIE